MYVCIYVHVPSSENRDVSYAKEKEKEKEKGERLLMG
jgi:hypothetical protein